MRVAVVGTGRLARSLVVRLKRAGYDVVVTELPGQEPPAGLAVDAGAEAEPLDEAVAGADVVFLAIPFGRFRDLPAETFAGKVVVDATDYDAADDGPMPELEATPSSQLLARHLAGARVVKALNTLNLLTLGETGLLAGDVPRPAVPAAGDDPKAKAVVSDILVDLGFDPVDAGALADSWRLQPGMPVHGLLTDIDDVRAKLALTS
ncbi:MAG: oxidoreductase coenzyme F420-dependent [Frankiales bacterium]|jgi:predicted dinucleotide-binding enzyme|nr:oxidoreductase coenzyme F420-dependent [Frankiales bacterium]